MVSYLASAEPRDGSENRNLDAYGRKNKPNGTEGDAKRVDKQKGEMGGEE